MSTPWSGLKRNVNKARGYIASGVFQSHRAPQHIQNQVIRSYCNQKNLIYVLSRAEYSMEVDSYCQLWAALEEGFENIVFYSIWQMPGQKKIRDKVTSHCIRKGITLHFACESLIADNVQAFTELELLIQIQCSIDYQQINGYLKQI